MRFLPAGGICYHPASMTTVVLQTALQGIKLHSRGKVRDMYDLGDHLLMVSTDRISAFDYVLPNGIPDKGKVLTGLSLFWFDVMREIVPNHLVTADVESYPEALRPHAALLRGRSMLVRRAKMFPVECVVRGYLAGSGHKEYLESGSVCGIKLPAGLRMADRLPELIFTPATKAENGHDINITFEEFAGIIGAERAARLRQLSLSIFRRATEVAEMAGIIIADTKFEFGVADDRIILCDEALTPDSSRFWDKSLYRPGVSPASFDKQFVRDYLESIRWNKTPPVPTLPDEIVQGTRAKYLEIYSKLSGRPLG
jgi:phosphoribosylaminoimidazole-succinocarboxamide synthase